VSSVHRLSPPESDLSSQLAVRGRL
jgi:hypothetical protein